MSEEGNNNNVPPTDAGGEEVKSEAGEQINLKVQSQTGAEVFFKIKKSTPLSKLMNAYCGKNGLNPHSIRFLYEGRRIEADSTPKMMNMEDNDVIDVLLMQTGGSF